MFLHTLIQKEQIDLDELLDKMKNYSHWVEIGRNTFGPMEYSFIVDCVEKQIRLIKEYTPMPLDPEEGTE